MPGPWKRDELLQVLRLYCHTPFGKLHRNNPDIIALAEAIGRTPGAVAMKSTNFAHIDPNVPRAGLGNVSAADRALWNEFFEDSERLALEMEETRVGRLEPPAGPTESVREVKVRLVQGFFRKALLTGYDHSCAISGLRVPGLLVASHIIPWRASEARRGHPSNGILLNGLYDMAFDKGYMTFDDDWRVLLAKDLKSHLADSDPSNDLCRRLLDIEGAPLRKPSRFFPDPTAMAYHRSHCFEQFARR